MDDKGKTRHIPRPVYALRKWNSLKNCYESISPILDNAPTDLKDIQKEWSSKFAIVNFVKIA